MEKESKKKNDSGINEDLMMNLMVDGVQKEGLKLPTEYEPDSETKQIENKEPLPNKPLLKDKGPAKKTSAADYESIFFKKAETNARDGKTVYIRPDFHEKMSRIVQVIGEDKITIYAYLDNLLDFHFKEFGEQITKSFNNKYKPIL